MSLPAWSIRTARLELRPVLADDRAEALASLSARVVEDSDDAAPTAQRLEHARQTIERSARSFAAHGFGLWWVLPEGAGAPVGWCGLKDGDDPARPELMYGLLVSSRGAGLAAEAVRAVVAHAFALPGVVEVWGATRPENDASARVMLRAGLLAQGVRTLDDRAYLVFGTAGHPA